MRDPSSTIGPRRVGLVPDGAGDASAVPSPPAFTASLADLRSAVAILAAARRADGAPLERVLAEVGALLSRAELLERAPGELALLADELRRWSAEAYHAAPERTAVLRLV